MVWSVVDEIDTCRKLQANYWFYMGQYYRLKAERARAGKPQLPDDAYVQYRETKELSKSLAKGLRRIVDYYKESMNEPASAWW